MLLLCHTATSSQLDQALLRLQSTTALHHAGLKFYLGAGERHTIAGTKEHCIHAEYGQAGQQMAKCLGDRVDAQIQLQYSSIVMLPCRLRMGGQCAACILLILAALVGAQDAGQDLAEQQYSKALEIR